MTVEDALYILLRDNAGVSALVATRISPGVLKQDTAYPAIAYRLVSRNEGLMLQSPGVSGLIQSRFRFFSANKGASSTARSVDFAVRQALRGSITVTSGAESVNIQGMFLSNSTDLYDDQTQTYQVVSDFEVWHEE